MIRITPPKIRTTPSIIRGVSLSWKNTTPKKIAVKGSKAPRIAVGVEPISLMAIVIVSREIIVGNTASAIVHNHKNGLCMI